MQDVLKLINYGDNSPNKEKASADLLKIDESLLHYKNNKKVEQILNEVEKHEYSIDEADSVEIRKDSNYNSPLRKDSLQLVDSDKKDTNQYNKNKNIIVQNVQNNINAKDVHDEKNQFTIDQNTNFTNIPNT